MFLCLNVTDRFLQKTLPGVSDSAGWHELLRVKRKCDKKCNEEGFFL